MPLDMTNFKLERKDKINSNEIRKQKQAKCLIVTPAFGALHIISLLLTVLIAKAIGWK